MGKINLRRFFVALGLGSLVSQLPWGFLYADNSASSLKFVQSSAPPPGFEDSQLDVTQSNYISVYYGQQFLGNILGTYDDKTVEFKDIESLVNKISGVQNVSLVVQALTGSLPNNADHLCPQTNNPLNKPYCSYVSPKVAAVIFDVDNYRATIFINPDYLSAAPETVKTVNLPNATAGFSYLGANNLSMSTTTGQQTYSLTNQSYFADGDNMLQVQSNLTQTNTTATSANTSSGGSGNQVFGSSSVLTLQSVAFNRLYNGIYYQAGMFTPYTGNFISGQSIVGVSMQNYGIIPSGAQGTPLPIFLPLPAQVAVYKNGYLISTQNFDAGKQLVDTSIFPVGSYDVQLKITNSLGQTITQTQFFVKQASLPLKGDPNYQISFGIPQSNQNQTVGSGSVVLPSFLTNVPFFNFTQTRLLINDLGLQSTIETNFNRAYLVEALTYYAANWQASPGVLVSNNSQYGWLFNFILTPQFLPNFSVTSNNQKIYNLPNTTSSTSSGSTSSLQTSSTLIGPSFLPLTQNSFQSNNSLNWAFNPKSTLSANYQITTIPGQGPQTQYGANFNYTLISNALLNLQLLTTLTHTPGSGITVTAGFSAGFTTASGITLSAGVGVDNSTQITNTNTNTISNVYKPDYNASVSKTFYWGSQNLDNIGFTGSVVHNYSNDTDSINSFFTTSYAAGNVNFSRNIARTYTTTNNVLNSTASTNWQLSGNVMNTVVYSGGHWSAGYNGGSTSGIMVFLDAPDKTAAADVFVNGQNMGRVKADSAKGFYVSPYYTYNVTVEPDGAAQYGFDQTPRIVTLYNGSVQYLRWIFTRQYVLFAKIVDAKGNVLSNLLLESANPNDFNVTDASGFIQANIADNVKDLRFKAMDGSECEVHLPASVKPSSDGLIVLDQPLVCGAIQ